MSRLFIVAVVLALAVLGAQAKLDAPTLAQHCRALTVYASGPGSYKNYLERLAFYFDETGEFHVPGTSDTNIVKTKEDWVTEANDELEKYNTFNHVFYPKDPVITGNTCTFEVIHGFLAWDGACGPLLTKSVVSYTVTGDTAAGAKITKARFYQNSENIEAQIKSCKQ